MAGPTARRRGSWLPLDRLCKARLHNGGVTKSQLATAIARELRVCVCA
jgi:hypothetical protein